MQRISFLFALITAARRAREKEKQQRGDDVKSTSKLTEKGGANQIKLGARKEEEKLRIFTFHCCCRCSRLIVSFELS
jgi:hypothetical protein